jgi:hypothetical protein
MLVAIGCFEDCLVNVEVQAFYNAVHAQVVAADTNVLDVVLLLQVAECGDEWLAVV